MRKAVLALSTLALAGLGFAGAPASAQDPDVIFKKSSRFSGELKRAVPPVGMMWLGPAV